MEIRQGKLKCKKKSSYVMNKLLRNRFQATPLLNYSIASSTLLIVFCSAAIKTDSVVSQRCSS